MTNTKIEEIKPKKISIINAAFLLMTATFIGQLLGFLRTKLVNANFPITGPHGTDAYFAAFNVPDFFFFTLSAGVVGVAVMPILSDRLSKVGVKHMWELVSSLLNFLSLIMLFVAIIILIFADQLIRYVVAPHLPAAEMHTAATILRLLAFNPFLFTISGLLTAAQQSLGRFFFYAITPIIYNLSIILSIFVFRFNLGLVGLGVGAVIGAVLQLLIVSIGLIKTNFSWTPKIMYKHADFKAVLRNLPPRSLDQGMDQLEDIVETHIASGISSGAISYFNNAYILSTAPILLLGTAISTAAFPRLNRSLSEGKPDEFRADFRRILLILIWISAPVVIISYFTRGYLARIIFSRGNEQISLIFGFLCIAIFFRILYSMISRWFYSNKDTITPLIVSIFTIFLNIVLAVYLSKSSRYGVAGLAIAQSIVAFIEVLVLGSIMTYRDRKIFDMKFLRNLIKIGSVCGFTLVAGYLMISLYPLESKDKGFFQLGIRLSAIALTTLAVHLLISRALELEEAYPVFNRVKRFIIRPIRIEEL